MQADGHDMFVIDPDKRNVDEKYGCRFWLSIPVSANIARAADRS